MSQDRAPNAIALDARVNVEVIKQDGIDLWLDHEEAYPFAIEFNVTRVLGRTASAKPLSRSIGIKQADMHKTFSHGLNPEGNKRLEIAEFRRGERDCAVRQRRYRHGTYAL